MKKLNVVKLEESIWKCDIKKRKRHNICSRVNDCWFTCNLNSTILLWLQFVCNNYYDQLSHKTDFSRRLLLPMVKKVGLLGRRNKIRRVMVPFWSTGFIVLSWRSLTRTTETAVQKCSQEKVFWKYAANLQENTHAEVRFENTQA